MAGLLSPSYYYNHLCLLVAALHILYSDYIISARLDKAEQLLQEFYLKFSELYGKYFYVSRNYYSSMYMQVINKLL